MKTYFRVDFDYTNPAVVVKRLGITLSGMVSVYAIPNTQLDQFEAYGKETFPEVVKMMEKDRPNSKVTYKITTISRSTYYRERNKCE